MIGNSSLSLFLHFLLQFDYLSIFCTRNVTRNKWICWLTFGLCVKLSLTFGNKLHKSGKPCLVHDLPMALSKHPLSAGVTGRSDGQTALSGTIINLGILVIIIRGQITKSWPRPKLSISKWSWSWRTSIFLLGGAP